MRWQNLFTRRNTEQILALLGILCTVLSFTQSTSWILCLVGIFVGFLAIFTAQVARQMCKERKEIEIERHALEIAMSRDMKLFFPKGSQVYYNVLKGTNLLTSSTESEIFFVKKDFIDNDKALRQHYFPFADLVADKTKSVVCRIINKSQKAEKCFIQLGFIPLDKNKRTILVERLPQNHGSAFDKKLAASRSEDKRKHINDSSFLISFSPIPDRYSESIDIYTTEFEEVGFVIRDWKIDNKLPCYCFYIFLVRYPDCDFRDKEQLNEIFIEKKSGEYFLKDHDPIVQVLSFKELSSLSDNSEVTGVLEEFVNKIQMRKIDKCIADDLAHDSRFYT